MHSMGQRKHDRERKHTVASQKQQGYRSHSTHPRHAESAVDPPLASRLDEEDVSLSIPRFLENLHLPQDHLKATATPTATAAQQRQQNERVDASIGKQKESGRCNLSLALSLLVLSPLP